MKKNKNTKNNEAGAISSVLISSLAYLVMGIILIIFPNSISNVLCYALGIVVTIYGLFNIVVFFLKKENNNMYLELIVGVVATAFGIFTLFSPSVIVNIIFVTIGIIIIIDSLMDIKNSFQLKVLGMKYWWVCAVISVLVILLGLSTIFFPTFFGNFLIFLLGIVMIYEGVSGLFIMGLISHYARKFGRDTKIIEVEASDV